MQKKYLARILVIIQFTCLAALYFTGPVMAQNTFNIITEILSILILVWSVSVMSISKLNVFPDIRKGSVFISNGPYKYIRHPMYLAVILFSISVVFDYMNVIRIIILIVLIATLIYKIEFEEKLLINHFEKYPQYRNKTKKLIPFIY
jgi:protein-S-isoprenylcysteine O-methyltransferase Ste14